MENNLTSAFRQKDIRIQKTNKALHDTLFKLLNCRNFNDITIKDLCSEALISRATFYAHYNDKYDLLKCFLFEIRKDIVKDLDNYNKLEKEVNQFIYLNKKMIANVLTDANNETLMLVRGVMSSIVDLVIDRKVNKQSPQHIIMLNFFVGGLVNLLTWIVENGFPSEIKMMNIYLYKMMEFPASWDAGQDIAGSGDSS